MCEYVLVYMCRFVCVGIGVWIVCVAVPGRNRTLFRCIFHPFTTLKVLYHRSTVKGKAHICYVHLSGNHALMLRVCTLSLMEVLRYSALNVTNTQQNRVWFLPRTATCVCSGVGMGVLAKILQRLNCSQVPKALMLCVWNWVRMFYAPHLMAESQAHTN